MQRKRIIEICVWVTVVISLGFALDHTYRAGYINGVHSTAKQCARYLDKCFQ